MAVLLAPVFSQGWLEIVDLTTRIELTDQQESLKLTNMLLHRTEATLPRVEATKITPQWPPFDVSILLPRLFTGERIYLIWNRKGPRPRLQDMSLHIHVIQLS
jgi:hypothetical protein